MTALNKIEAKLKKRTIGLYDIYRLVRAVKYMLEKIEYGYEPEYPGLRDDLKIEVERILLGKRKKRGNK